MINDLQQKLRLSELAIIEKDRLAAAHMEQSNRVEKDMREKEKELDSLRKRLTALQSENDVLKEKIGELEAKVRELQAERTVLAEKMATLAAENVELKKEVSSLREDLASAAAIHTQDIAGLTNRISALESRDRPITVREIMRTIEKHVSLAVAGSKTQAKTYYNFDRIGREPNLKAALDNLVTADVQSMIGRLKDNGDDAAHDKRPPTTLEELETFLVDEDDNHRKEVLNLAKTYLVDPASGLLSFVKPFSPC